MAVDIRQAQEQWEETETLNELGGTDQYRALSPVAVVAFILAIASVTAWLSEVMLLVPILGVIFGLVAMQRIKANPTELTGLRLAKTAVLISAVLLVKGTARHTYIYITEVPENHQRISFDQLRVDKKVAHQHVPQSAHELDGEQVFIKGYVFAGGRQLDNISKFVLVRDRGDCCFGGDPPITDRILVTLANTKMSFVEGVPVKVAGKFRVQHQGGVDGVSGVYYHIDGAQLR